MLQRLAMEKISSSKKRKYIYDWHDQQLDSFDDNPDLDNVIFDDDLTEEVEMQSTKSKGHYHLTYPHLDRVISDFKNRRPLSVIRLQEGEYGCILRGNKFIPIFCGTSQWITNNESFRVFFEWKLAGSELLHNITNASVKNMSIFWILLPKLNESGLWLISDTNDEASCSTLIDCNWYTMQQDKSIVFAKFPGASYIETLLLITMMRWKDQIKYDIDALFILHSCEYATAIDDDT